MNDVANVGVLPADRGAGPFVTLRHFATRDGSLIWRARNHRKGLGAQREAGLLWHSRGVNVGMALGFAAGSVLFALGAVLSFSPQLARSLSLSDQAANQIFFWGSVFFTLAAYLQLLQAANAPPNPDKEDRRSGTALLGWRPEDPGWLSSAVQFAGTLLFNANTYDAMLGGQNWLRQDLTIWAPDAIGSVFFLISGYLVLIETTHGWWAWRPRDLAWYIVTANFLGCIAFMVAAILAFVPPGGSAAALVAVSNGFTLAGSIGFLVGAVLGVKEGAAAQ